MNTSVPTRKIGPIKYRTNNGIENDVYVPLATYETTLWPSVNRGAKISQLVGGINTTIIKDIMTRSVLFETKSIFDAQKAASIIENEFDNLNNVTTVTSKFAKLTSIHTHIVSNMVFVRFAFNVCEASGHNMTTKAADAIINYLLDKYVDLIKYVSISGNYCVDKKNSAVNSILGRGKYVTAEMNISDDICRKYLRATPAEISNLNQKKNLVGSIISGSVCSANAHFANMLLAIYIATGQDAANIVEGSQGITIAETRDNGDLYFSVTLPNVIVGVIGNGKHQESVKENLKLLGCIDNKEENYSSNNQKLNSQKLASIIAATVLCGELSLLAAQTNRGELVKSHMKYERSNK